MSHSNEWYLSGLRKGSKEVVNAIAADCYPMLRSFVLNNRGKEEDAKDLFGITVEALYRKLKEDPSFALRSAKFSSYFFEIGKRRWMNTLRKKSFSSEVASSGSHLLDQKEELTESLDKSERYRLFRKKFTELPDKCRRILSMTWHTDLKLEEIAKKLDFTYGYVRKRKALCTKQLTQLVRADVRYQELQFNA